MRELYLHKRFFYLLTAGVFSLVLAYIFPLLYAWVLWLLLICGMLVIADLLLLFCFGRAVEAERLVAEKLSNGENNPVTIKITNRYPFLVNVRVLDEIPVQFQLRDLEMRARLNSSETGELCYSLRPVKRGEYVFGQIRVFVSSVFSLVERRYSFASGQMVRVYPSFIAMRKYELMAYAGRQGGNGTKRIRIPGVTTAFEQIKPYVAGDDPRAVNWKATARSGRLMTNSYTEERAQQVYCVIDKGRTMQLPFSGMTMLDYAVNASLALADVALRKGDKAGLFTFSNKPGAMIRADNRRMQLSDISETLYNLRTNYLESDFDLLCAMAERQVRTRSLLVLFTNFDTVAGMNRRLPALRRLAASHLLFVVIFEDSEMRKVVAEPARSTKDIYFKTIAGSFLLEKKQIIRELRNAGIYALLTPPEGLTTNTINGYLELKERGML